MAQKEFAKRLLSNFQDEQLKPTKKQMDAYDEIFAKMDTPL